MARRISNRGIVELQVFEGFKNHPYQDNGDVWTIGFGHTKGVTESTENITREQGNKILMEDLQPVQEYINAHFPLLSQDQYDMVCSLLFNIGTDLEKYNLYRLLVRNPNDRHVAYEWIEFCLDSNGNFDKGLLIRRAKEIIYYFK